MRLVVDTNVLVSAMLGAGRVPDQFLGLLTKCGATVLFDARIRAEYTDVVRRPKFRAITEERRESMLRSLLALGTELSDVPPFEGELHDADDRIFIEVALAGGADAIVTGNLKDYPNDLGFDVLPPATALARLEALYCASTIERTSSS